ncbi:hypothetical protein SAMN05428988_0940 [Chitinophaga sp. YR573]|nr:hypothetical protein SAMN05428988_0940 [Chitinophaga sp. YR573]
MQLVVSMIKAIYKNLIYVLLARFRLYCPIWVGSDRINKKNYEGFYIGKDILEK